MSSLRDLVQSFALASYFGDVRKRSRAAGIDGLTPDAYAQHLDAKLERLRDALLNDSWQPSRLLRIRQAKPDGRFRVLAIPTVEDRIVLELLRRGLEPIIEPTLHDAAFAYRPRRSARTAVDTVSAAIERGATWVALADVRDFFDSVRIRSVLQAIDGLSVDPALCRLLDKVLAHHALQPGRGLAQGSCLSPLLSNLALTPLDRNLHSAGFDLVRYCDNLCVTTSSNERASAALARIEMETKRLGLLLKPTASRVASVESGFLWLGFWLATNGRRVSDGALQALVSRANAAGHGIAPQHVSEKLEPIVRGWMQYFDVSIPTEFHLGEHDVILRHLFARFSSAPNTTTDTNSDASSAPAAPTDAELDDDPWLWENTSRRDEIEPVQTATQESLLVDADRLASEGQFEAAERSWEAAQRAKEEPATKNSTSEPDEPLWDGEWLDRFIGLFAARLDAFEVLTPGPGGNRQTALMRRHLEPGDVRAHLLGRGALAIRPRFADGSALLGVIDIDGTSAPVERHTLTYTQRLCNIARAWEWHVLFEMTGGRGLHVWLPLAEPMRADTLHAALQSLLRAAGPLPEGIATEVFPAPDDAPDLHAQSMTLPLGMHVESRVRSRLFLADGTEIAQDLQGLASIRPTLPERLTEFGLIPSRTSDVPTSRTESSPDWSRFGRDVERVMGGCALLRHLAEKSRDIGHLVHSERLSLLYSLGHLAAPGEQAIHSIVGMCRNYDVAETSRQIANLRGLPVSCSRLREKHATPDLLPHCHCDFGDVRHRGGYATPLLHAGAFRRTWRNVLRERRDLEVALKNDENVGVRVAEETVGEGAIKLKGLPPHEWA